MSRSIRASCAAFALALCVAAVARADDKADIKASGKAFADAMHSGDAATARKLAYTDAGSEKLLDGLIAMTSGRKQLTDAAVTKYGEEGRTIVGQGTTRTPQFDHNFDDAEIEVNGDTAVVTPKSGKPFNFKKDGSWKIDFTKFPNKEQFERSMPMLSAISTAMTSTADEIKADKYPTLAEAKQAFHLKVASSIGIPGAPGGPAGRPSAPPAEK